MDAKQFGTAERAKAIKERDRAQVIIDYWDRILGDSGESAADESTPEFSASGGSSAADFVGDAELVGMSAPKAIRLIMNRMSSKTGMNRALRVPEIHAALQKGGIDYKRDQLYTTLPRSPMFHSPQKGLWGLSVWYPGVAKKGGAGSSEAIGDNNAPIPESRYINEVSASNGADALDRAEGR